MALKGLDKMAMRSILGRLDGKQFNAQMRKALIAECHDLRALMIQSFRLSKGGGVKQWASLSPATIALRRSVEKKSQGGRAMGKKALIATGQMRKAILVDATMWDEIFIGIPRGARRSPAGSAISIALVHEYGSVIRPTAKQKAWFWNAIRKARNAYANRILRERKKARMGGSSTGRGVSLWIIPPRPFITPSTEIWQKDLGRRLITRINENLAGLPHGGA